MGRGAQPEYRSGVVFTKRLAPFFIVASTALLACSENRSPFAGGGGGGARSRDATATSSTADSGQSGVDSGITGGDTGTNAGDTGTTAGNACSPTRFIVLGDSITACTGVGGKDGVRCSPNVLHQYIESTYAPGLTYENYSVEGAVTADVPTRQLPNVNGGPGHAIVLIYIGGNDLAQYIFVSDSQAQTEYNRLQPEILMHWASVKAFFNDSARFPDGVTFMMNTQYSPFDDCTAPPYNLSATKTSLLHMFNTEIARVASETPNARLTNQHMPFLGHGHHYSVASCASYTAGSDYWMSDLIHPNALGHANFVTLWKQLIDAELSPCQ